MSAHVVVRKNLGTLNWASFSLTQWQAAGRSCWAGGVWWMRRQGQFCTSQAGSALLHLFSTCLNSCPNQLITLFCPTALAGFPFSGVLSHSLFYSCNKSYKPIDQPKQQQKRRIMFIRLHCKALNRISFSINSFNLFWLHFEKGTVFTAWSC